MFILNPAHISGIRVSGSRLPFSRSTRIYRMPANSRALFQVLGHTGEQTESMSDTLQGSPPLLDELDSEFLCLIWLLNYKCVFIKLITLGPADLSASKGIGLY